MELHNKYLKEIIAISNSDISDFLLNETKFGDILNNLNELKTDNSSKIDSKKKKDNKKIILKEIIEEDSSLEDNSEENELDIDIFPIKNIKTFTKKNLFLNLDDKEIETKTQSYKKDNYEFSKKKTNESIDKIYEFIDSEENNIEKYLLDNKIIEKQALNEEEENDYNYNLEEDENIDNTLPTNTNNKVNIDKNQIIEIKKDNVNDNADNIINNYDGTKLFIIEKTEDFTFLKQESKEKDNSELKQYLNNKINIEQNNGNSIIINNSNKILYEIAEFKNKSILSQEFNNIRITSLFLDEKYIYIGDGGGRLLIYDLPKEKLIKQFMNPFPIENKRKLDIKSIYVSDHYIITSYEKGKLSIYSKNETNIEKTKLFESIQDITKEDIIEVKSYTKKNNNTIIIYCADSKENIYKIKIVKKIFKNKILAKRIISPDNTEKNIEPYYHIEINPFNHKIIGVVNNNVVSIYHIKKFEEFLLFPFNNACDNSFLSFCFSPKEENKNIFYIANMNRINICELNKDYNGVAQLNYIILQENIIKVGHFQNDLFYAFTEGNKIILKDFNNQIINKENKSYDFIDSFSIDVNNNINNKKDNASYLIDFKNHFSVKEGKMFIYINNKLFYLNSLSCNDGINKYKIKNNILSINNQEVIDDLFKIIIEIHNNIHPLWKNIDKNKLEQICIDYTNSYISLLIVELGNYKTDKEFEQVKNKFNKLIKFLFEINFTDFIIDDKNGLFSIILENKLNDLFFFLLEPYIIDNKFIDKKINNTFIINLINSYLNKENKYINLSKSWLSEMLLHFPINNILFVQNEIIQNYLINIILNITFNYKEVLNDDNIFNYCIPMNVMLQILREKLITINLDDKDLFIKENKYKDEIVFSNDYLRLKLIWYIYYVLKNEILNLNRDENDKINKLKISFVKNCLKILLEEDSLYLIIFNEIQNKKQGGESYILIKEIIFLFQFILDNAENLNKFCEINRDNFYRSTKDLLEKRKEFEICFKIFTIKNILKENISDISNKEKLNLVIFFMENNRSNYETYPEIKENNFENNLIEILKLIDSVNFNDSEKLLKLVNKCKGNYKKLGEYIIINFKKN